MNLFSFITPTSKKIKFKLFSCTSLYKLNFINYFDKNIKVSILHYNSILIAQSYKKKETDIYI